MSLRKQTAFYGLLFSLIAGIVWLNVQGRQVNVGVPSAFATYCNGDYECNDVNPCTDDICIDNACQYNNNTAGCTDDSNACTDDVCSEGSCTHPANTAGCNDANACTTGEACSGGVCTGGSGISCDDSNACTDDSCDTGTGCQYSNNTAGCNDGNLCTSGDVCSGGSCGGSPVDCNDSNACTSDSCDNGSGCVNTGISCDDNNACTTDSCRSAEGCINENNTAECNDGNACTTGEACSNGSCTGGTSPSCDDNNPCTSNSCNPSSGYCEWPNNTEACNDGNACTTGDTCSGGSCGGSPVNCNDSNVCTTDTCESASGCVNTPNATECDDGNACTSTDSCSYGDCSGSPIAGCCNNDAVCSGVTPRCNTDTHVCVECMVDGNCASGYICSGNACVSFCSDGLVKGSEACDDGGAAAGDGCSATCSVETGWSCAGEPSICEKCGNGLKEGTEACDDGGVVNSDGCSGVCAIETGWSCTGTPSVCTLDCGNGSINGSEECDDGNLTSGDGCTSACVTEECGDGVINNDGAESCDDGNATAGDGCSAACAEESKWTCDTTVSPTTCTENSTDAGGGAANRYQKLIEFGIIPGNDSGGETTGGNASSAPIPVEVSGTPETPSEPASETVNEIIIVPVTAAGGGESANIAVPSTEWYTNAVIDVAKSGLFPAISNAAQGSESTFVPAATIRGRDMERILNRLEGPATLHRTADSEPASDGTSSHTPLTRGEAIRQILAQLGVPLENPEKSPFQDLPLSSPYASAIATAEQLGIMTGDTTPTGRLRHTVRPDDPMNQAEMVMIIERLKKAKLLR